MPPRVLNRLNCPYCDCTFKKQNGRTYHIRSAHPTPSAAHPPTVDEAVVIDEDQEDNYNVLDPWIDVHDNDNDNGPPGDNPGVRAGSQRTKTHGFLTGWPCDETGQYLPTGTPPPACSDRLPTDWSPFRDGTQFHVADFIFRKGELSAPDIDWLLELWAFDMARHNDTGPFSSVADVYETIDRIEDGDAPWKCFATSFQGEIGEEAPQWKKETYHVWYRDPDTVICNMLDNPDFKDLFDYSPYVFMDASGHRRWNNFMSGNFAWRQCGAMYVAIITGSDKTTVSVATGHVEYHPLYLSIGNVHNSVRRAHRNAVIPIGFLAIPKSDRKYDKDPAFRTFKRQLYHASLSAILQSLKPAMTTPVVRRCPDGHFRRVIFDIGPVIADYPEQVMLAGIVQGWCGRCTGKNSVLDGDGGRRTQEWTDLILGAWSPRIAWDEYGIDDGVVPFTHDFPRADIHELLAPDLLHQIIKGSFKDHIVEWVGDYLTITHGEARAGEIMDDIDRRISAAPAFPGLRRFPHGRRFKQWTGDDSKALMKVYIAAIVEYVPAAIVQTISALLDFYYLVRRPEFDADTLDAIDTAVSRFHHHREVFREAGVHPTGFSLPHQHAMSYYCVLIQDFGSANGLCSSITESRHITAVKKPWRRSNRYSALGQMLLTNQRLDKLIAIRATFVEHGMLPARHPRPAGQPPHGDEAMDDSHPVDELVPTDVVLPIRAREYNHPLPSQTTPLSLTISPLHLDRTSASIPRYANLPLLARQFLYEQLHPDGPRASTLAADELPEITSRIKVFHSATATFYAPSDVSGLQGMRREIIRCSPNWRKRGPRRDCVFMVEDEDKPGMRGMATGRVKLFFSFTHAHIVYPCIFVDHFKRMGNAPDPVTGMWKLRPETSCTDMRIQSVEHLDSVLRSAHLLPVFGVGFIPHDFRFSYSLDSFTSYYVNKYADHHIYEIAF
ncbi:hypothetical protein OF83DRAFT_1165069 [Amylostereum chailletii]|nr:hypothetical protein OF83DRAFT_1165069 [Amylostereum chailletii]